MSGASLQRPSNVLLIAAFAFAALEAHAGDKPEILTNIYKSCENVKIVSKKTVQKFPATWGKEVAHCAQTQVGLDTSFWKSTIEDPNDFILAKSLTERLAQKHKANLETNIAAIKQVVACYDRKNPGYAGESCNQTRQGVRAKTEATAAQARLELALSLGRDTDYGYSSAEHMMQDVNINKSVRPFSGFLTSAVSRQDLLPSEYAAAKAIREAEYLQARILYPPQPKDDLHDPADYSKAYYQNSLIRSTDEHRARFRKITQFESPILNYLKPTRWEESSISTSNGETQKIAAPKWSEDDLGDALKQVLANAEKQKGITDRAIARGTLEFGRWFGGDIPFERLYNSVINDERDLLDFIVFTPVVEEVLKEHPEYCGTATSLAQHIKNRAMRSGTEIGLMILPIGVYAGTAAASAAAAGTASAGAIVSTGLGLASGGAFLAASASEHDRILERAYVASGVSDQEKRVMDPKDIEESERQVTLNIATLPLSFMGAGAAGGAVKKFIANAAMRNKMVEAGVSEDLAKTMVRLANNPDVKVRDAAKDKIQEFLNGVAKAEKELFRGRAPTEMENNLIQWAASKGFLGSAGSPDAEGIREFARIASELTDKERMIWEQTLADLVQKISPANNAQEGHVRFQAMMVASRLGMNNPVEMVKLFSDPTWKGDALVAAVQVMGKAARNVGALRASGMSPEAARSQAFKAAYIEIKNGRPLNQLSEREARTALADALNACRCFAYCPAAAAAATSDPAQPAYVACLDPARGLR